MGNKTINKHIIAGRRLSNDTKNVESNTTSNITMNRAFGWFLPHVSTKNSFGSMSNRSQNTYKGIWTIPKVKQAK